MNDNNHVFINCPFDKKYTELFLAIIFTVQDCGFVARCSLEKDNANEDRFAKIIRIINECDYGIHDISRIELDADNKMPRFNMPFELGLFFGAIKFGEKKNKLKNCLVLERNLHECKKYLSDLSGTDPKAHKDEPKSIIRHIRNWLYNESHNEDIPAYITIKKHYESFSKQFSVICDNSHMDCFEMPFFELIKNINQWLEDNNTP